MAGKRFQVKDWAELEAALGKYGLATNKNHGDNFTVRRLTNYQFITARYRIEHSFDDWADFEDGDGYDVCIGKVIAYAKIVAETELSEIEKILCEVKEDIPDAKLLVFSNWV